MQLRECDKCELGRKGVSPIAGEGKGRLLIVGEAPGDGEKKPFSDATKSVIDRFLATMGLDRSKVRLTYAIKCNLPGSRRPLDKEIAACLSWLIEEIRESEPELILALGRTAARALINRNRVEDLRGKVHWFHAIPVIVTFHPVVFNRFPKMRRPILEDMKAVRKKLKRLELEKSENYSLSEWMRAGE